MVIWYQESLNLPPDGTTSLLLLRQLKLYMCTEGSVLASSIYTLIPSWNPGLKINVSDSLLVPVHLLVTISMCAVVAMGCGVRVPCTSWMLSR